MQKLAAAVDLDPSLDSGHSPRAGFATRAAMNGFEERRIARQARPQSSVVGVYIRDGEVLGSGADQHGGEWPLSPLAGVDDAREEGAMSAKYDLIGVNYAELRKPDRRIARIIEGALGSARTVLNVGAGTGSYEPADRSLTAVEPSREMIRRRAPAAAKAVQASADDLPFGDGSFDASMAVLTVHHWPDKEAGLREMRRVTRGRVVLLTFDPSHRPWLTDYLPELAALDEAQMPAMSD